MQVFFITSALSSLLSFAALSGLIMPSAAGSEMAATLLAVSSSGALLSALSIDN